MSRLCLYYRLDPERDRWLPADRFVRPLIRRLVRGKPRPGGVEKVFINLCLGLDKLGVRYSVNLPFRELRHDDLVGILGRGRKCLGGYAQPNPIVAGIGLMTHPSEWPTLCDDFPVVKYLQHSHWANAVYEPYFGDRCVIWPVGIDTEKWKPNYKTHKKETRKAENNLVDFLIYDKIMWEAELTSREIKHSILRELKKRNLSFEIIRYGNYGPHEFQQALGRSRAMIFLCEHESQGLAYQEALSSGVPIIAWDQGWCLDPNRFQWGQPKIPASSVPYFDERCGVKFKDASAFPGRLEEFLAKLEAKTFAPRTYILENLTLEKCSQNFINILHGEKPPTQT
jgi:glycosyltransferase involved in cell wall biosynthesis